MFPSTPAVLGVIDRRLTALRLDLLVMVSVA